MNIKTVRVNIKKGYDVLVGSELIKKSGEIINKFAEGKAAIITDDKVAPLYLKVLEESLEKSGFKVCSFKIKNGENSKNISSLSDILEFLAENELTRSDIVVALGGGVVGDIAGFASGVYLRGIKFIQIPTTLLAAVDSSVGGKTAVNLDKGKNLAGTFKQPETVICDVDLLSTLSEYDFANGIAESIKSAVLKDKELFYILKNDMIKRNLSEVIARCVKIKAEYVEKDELDTGERQFLNLGHTFAHTIEKKSEYKISHGHAVAIGLSMAAKAGCKLGITNKCVYEEIVSVLIKNNLPYKSPFNAKDLANIAYLDKKRKGDYITFVFIEDIGRCVLKKVSVNEVENIFLAGE